MKIGNWTVGLHNMSEMSEAPTWENTTRISKEIRKYKRIRETVKGMLEINTGRQPE